MTDFRAKLAHRFRDQEEFSRSYSPLYARLFGLLADWLAEPAGNLVADWLVTAANGRNPFDITLLLLAGLHRELLLQHPDVAGLAAFYPSVGGERPATDPALAAHLQQAILARRTALTPFIKTATVQTNETGRGLAWLLPLLYTGWESVHLVDLGASAGLNLAAERRSYRLVTDGRLHLQIGSGAPVQFQTECRGEFVPPHNQTWPSIISRTGCDLRPFPLKTEADEQTLAAFVWADQVHRLARLRQGIAAFRQANQSEAPIRLFPADLPDGLDNFLRQHVPDGAGVPDGAAPVLIYNTYMTIYLPDRGASFQQKIGDWAQTQKRSVLWVQWEPDWEDREPVFGWLRWTADLWQNGRHQQWQIGWVHPHGGEAQWLPDLAAWALDGNGG